MVNFHIYDCQYRVFVLFILKTLHTCGVKKYFLVFINNINYLMHENEAVNIKLMQSIILNLFIIYAFYFKDTNSIVSILTYKPVF